MNSLSYSSSEGCVWFFSNLVVIARHDVQMSLRDGSSIIAWRYGAVYSAGEPGNTSRRTRRPKTFDVNRESQVECTLASCRGAASALTV
jgi:hypothetical protein